MSSTKSRGSKKVSVAEPLISGSLFLAIDSFSLNEIKSVLDIIYSRVGGLKEISSN